MKEREERDYFEVNLEGVSTTGRSLLPRPQTGRCIKVLV